MTPSSSSSASSRATCTTAPDETPAKMPSRSRRCADARDRLLVGHEDLPVEAGDVEDRRHVPVGEGAKAVDEVALKRFRGGDDDVGERLA